MKINKIYNMDCLEGMKQLEDNSVDLVLTDPPYFAPAQHYSPSRKNIFTQRYVGDLSILEHFMHSWIKEVLRVIKDNGHIYIFCDSQSYPLIFTGLYSNVKVIRTIVWNKITAFNGYTWRHQHELIAYAEMPNATKIPTSDGDIIKHRVVALEDRKHPAQKPLDIIRKIIYKHKEAEIILDPFIGSGTTAVACKQLNRNFIGFEINKEYCDIANKRLEQSNLKEILNG